MQFIVITMKDRQTPLHFLKGKDLDYYYYNVRPDIMYLKFD